MAALEDDVQMDLDVKESGGNPVVDIGAVRAALEAKLQHLPRVQANMQAAHEAGESLQALKQWVHAQPGYSAAYHAATRMTWEAVTKADESLRDITHKEWREVCQYLGYRLCLPAKCFTKLQQEAAAAGGRGATPAQLSAKCILESWARVQKLWPAIKRLWQKSPFRNHTEMASCMRRLVQCYTMRETEATKLHPDERKRFCPLPVQSGEHLPLPPPEVQFADAKTLRVVHLLKDEEELQIYMRAELGTAEALDELKAYRQVREQRRRNAELAGEIKARQVSIQRMSDSKQREQANREFSNWVQRRRSALTEEFKKKGAFDPVGGFVVHEELMPLVNAMYNITHVQHIMTPHLRRIGRMISQASGNQEEYIQACTEHFHSPSFPPPEFERMLENLMVSRNQAAMFFLNYQISQLATQLQQARAPVLQHVQEEHERLRQQGPPRLQRAQSEHKSSAA